MSDPLPGWRRVHGPLASLQRGAGPRLVFVHGFTQTGRSWLPVAESFIDSHEVVLVDAPGHGWSAEVSVDMAVGADMLAEVGGKASYVGYSMGGRLCLHLAVAHPHLVSSLVLLGATAGIDDDTLRAERQAADERLAIELETTGIEAFLKNWLALDLFANLHDDARGMNERMTNTVAGLASSLRLAGTGSQASLWALLDLVASPTLVLAGELDPKFTELGHRLRDEIGDSATFSTIAGTGHAAHLEAPALVARRIADFLQNPASAPNG